MQRIAQTTPSPSFAGLMAALATPGRKPSPAWNDDDLADDVATLSYEHALRAHSRHRGRDSHSDAESASDSNDWSQGQIARSAPVDAYEVVPASGGSVAQGATCRAPYAAGTPPPETAENLSTPLERNLKSASITIRVSKSESIQLQKRAAEAGLTVSAYLRSCTFEVESLRALVKETMAQLRAATSESTQSAPVPAHRSGLQWLVRFFMPWHRNQRAARA
jgi:hypothetical protein